MKQSITVISGVLLFALVGAAQNDVPKYEAFLGFTYVRANQFNQNTGLGTSIGGFSMYGGSGQLSYNFNKWISAVGDFGAVNKPNVGTINASNTTAFTLFGPRVHYRRGHRWSPFGEVLFGAAYRAVSTGVYAVTGPDTPVIPVANPSTLFPGPNTPVSAQLNANQNAFSLMAGGGLDCRLNKRFSFRPVEVDYVLTRFPSLSSGYRENQSSISASAGVIFTFGEQ